VPLEEATDLAAAAARGADLILFPRNGESESETNGGKDTVDYRRARTWAS
jgi:hypothetical protein